MKTLFLLTSLLLSAPSRASGQCRGEESMLDVKLELNQLRGTFRRGASSQPALEAALRAQDVALHALFDVTAKICRAYPYLSPEAEVSYRIFGTSEEPRAPLGRCVELQNSHALALEMLVELNDSIRKAESLLPAALGAFEKANGTTKAALASPGVPAPMRPNLRREAASLWAEHAPVPRLLTRVEGGLAQLQLMRSLVIYQEHYLGEKARKTCEQARLRRDNCENCDQSDSAL